MKILINQNSRYNGFGAYRKVLMLGITLLLLHCTNPFATRTPDEPDLGSGAGISDNSLQNDPNRIMEKLQQALSLKDARAYRTCLAEPERVSEMFVFTGDDAEMARLSGWTVEDEENYFNNLTGRADVQLELNPEQPLPTPVSSSPDTLQLDFDYTITVTLRAQNETYLGRSVIQVFKAADERWYINRWRDLRPAGKSISDSTWSTLKANYRIAPQPID